MTRESPQQPTLPEPIAAQLQFDDEVTSVSIAGSKGTRSSYEDDVVDSGATASGMGSWNDPVQEERLNLLRRSSHEAVAGARKRHLERATRERELVPFADDDEPQKADQAAADEAAQPESGASDFRIDDFVEEERGSANDDPAHDDEMVDEGTAPGPTRSPRLRKLLREPHDPKRNEAVRTGVPFGIQVTSHNPDYREQWNSVPTLKPGFELPFSKPERTESPVTDRVSASAATGATTSYQPSPVSQARELVSQKRLRQERSHRQMVAPLQEDERQQPDETPRDDAPARPRLTSAPTQDTPKVERIKTSPLRGYQPATKRLERKDRERTQRPGRPDREQAEHAPVEQRHASSAPRRGHSAVPQRQMNPGDRQVTVPRMRPGQDGQSVKPQTRRPVNPSQRGPQPRQEAMPRTEEPPRRRPDVQSARDENTQMRAEQVHREEAVREREGRRRDTLQVSRPDEPFQPLPIEISPTVPRCCGTCMSFKPSGVDGRGSCTNRFAGPVQRVVNADDLACQHLYGSLWIPADEEVWLEELPDHSAPTPRVDAMLARQRRREGPPPVLPDLEDLTS